MRLWKWLGLAGLVGISTTGAVMLARRRRWRNYDADELRERLHQRLAEAERRAQGDPIGPDRRGPGPGFVSG